MFSIKYNNICAPPFLVKRANIFTFLENLGPPALAGSNNPFSQSLLFALQISEENLHIPNPASLCPMWNFPKKLGQIIRQLSSLYSGCFPGQSAMDWEDPSINWKD